MINIALIGFGYWGPNVAKQLFSNPEIELSYICDKNEDRLNKAKSIYVEQTKYSHNFDEVINDASVSAVALAVETSAHFELAKRALESGKHVYVEKPFTSSVSEAEELKRIAQQNDLIIHVDHIMVFHPCVRKIKELLDAGEIGELLYFDAERQNLGQIKPDVSSMWDLAVHDLSIIDYLVGNKLPVHVSAVGEKFYNPKESVTFLSLGYDGFIAQITSSWISPLKERKFVLVGTKKMVVFDDMKQSEKLMIYDKGVDILSEGKKVEYMDYAVRTRTGDVHIPYVEAEDALYNSVEHFRSCIIKNTQSISGPDSAIHVIQVLEEADRKMNT